MLRFTTCGKNETPSLSWRIHEPNGRSRLAFSLICLAYISCRPGCLRAQPIPAARSSTGECGPVSRCCFGLCAGRRGADRNFAGRSAQCRGVTRAEPGARRARAGRARTARTPRVAAICLADGRNIGAVGRDREYRAGRRRCRRCTARTRDRIRGTARRAIFRPRTGARRRNGRNSPGARRRLGAGRHAGMGRSANPRRGRDRRGRPPRTRHARRTSALGGLDQARPGTAKRALTGA